LERRRTLQGKYDASIASAMSIVESCAISSKTHAEMRGRLSPHPAAVVVVGGGGGGLSSSSPPLQEARDQFELSKKTLKSDLKKCTAFVKKIKAGQYPSSKELELPNSAMRTLNLSRYVEEVAGALMEPTAKVKQSGEFSRLFFRVRVRCWTAPISFAANIVIPWFIRHC
jgi:hypothetical protein